jgi:hypothetical protein
VIQTLAQACHPRDSVFNPSVRDTVYSIDDLPLIDPKGFFAENFITDGMRQLLTEAFTRLEGKNQNASGAYLLSQSMGGGKTHNLIALGLLARNPGLRKEVMGDFYEPGPLGAVRVASFSGRKNTEFGIWGEIATQLKNTQAFQHLYSPLQPPGDVDWINLLDGPPTLIMLDELPPYLDAALGRTIGESTLAALTVRALANLLTAVASSKLPNVCVVLTDLSGSAYATASANLSGVLGNLEQEANRTVQRISPVRLNSPEFYSILRKRLFDQLPDEQIVADVAQAHADAVDEARRLDLTTASPPELRANIERSYPFHPGLQDLYARFRENQGFQQTRALIRLMRMVVARLWDTDDANTKYLIGAQDLDLSEAAVITEINQINNSLENAIAHDIARDGGGAVAQAIDSGGGSNAQDAARLIFMSSLSRATNPTLGLTRSEIVLYLASPRRDLSGLTHALDQLQIEAWYLHATHDGRLLFRNTENLNAKLETYARGVTREDRERGLSDRLKDMFAPKVRDVYQVLEPIPALDQVQLTADKTTLIVVRPDSSIRAEINAFWDNQQFKNRVLFLTARQQEYAPILEHMGYIRAIDAILTEFQNEGVRDADPQVRDAREIRTKYESRFYMAFREAFQTLLYPSRNGLVELELDAKYVANSYEGEQQIRHALIEAHQFRESIGDLDGFRTSVENRLWPEGIKEVSWNDLKRRAAQDPTWLLHDPRALDDLKQDLVTRDQWRDLGNGFVQRGPFPQPPTSVSVQVLSRDPNTGETRLRVTPRHADRVRVAEDGVATPYSTELDGWELTTRDVTLSFLAEDTKGEHEAGEPIVWKNTIDVRYRTFKVGDQRTCELQAIPSGEIRYTTDGASPQTSGRTYTEPFAIAKTEVLVLAIASENGVRSEQVRFAIPADSARDLVKVDPQRPARWTRTFNQDATTETFAFLELLARHDASLGGVQASGQRDQQYWEFITDPQSLKSVAEIRQITDLMLNLFPGRNVTLKTEVLAFERGQELIDLVATLKTELKPNEVKQDQ